MINIKRIATKTILSVFCLWVLIKAVQPAFAAPSSADQLIALGFSPPQAKKLVEIVNNLASPFSNNTWMTFRNAANNANINGFKVDGTDDTVINADTGDVIKLQVAGTTEATIDNDSLTFSGASATVAFGATSGILSLNGTNELVLTDNKLSFASVAGESVTIATSSVDATDTNTLTVAAASAFGDGRGAAIRMYGNEVATNGGRVNINAGNVSTAQVNINLEDPSSTFNIIDTTSGTVATVTDAGAATFASSITSTAGNITATSGDFVASASGKTVSLQEAANVWAAEPTTGPPRLQ